MDSCHRSVTLSGSQWAQDKSLSSSHLVWWVTGPLLSASEEELKPLGVTGTLGGTAGQEGLEWAPPALGELMHCHNSPWGGWSHPTLQKRTQEVRKRQQIVQGSRTELIPAHSCGALKGRPFLSPPTDHEEQGGQQEPSEQPLLSKALLSLLSPPDLLRGLTAHLRAPVLAPTENVPAGNSPLGGGGSSKG